MPDAVDGVHKLGLREPGVGRYQHEWRMWQGGRRDWGFGTVPVDPGECVPIHDLMGGKDPVLGEIAE